VHEWGYECNLEPDLLTTQRRSAWQGGDLVESTGELLSHLNQCGARQRALPRFAPKSCRFLDQSGISVMTRQQFWLVLGYVSELALKGFGDTGVKRASWVA
jgi:hypothetical protein